ncbi:MULTISPECIES: ABC transporter permease [Psychrilyobacter]|uniref:ABC transporter permease n=1 Tax=Psychrilyobacter piezotolerans TaxID=2293438 RepID=A0ABX9KIA4_9FUSO|nr:MULTISPECIES: FtsX-like permease family protein [Psychrilyobacter]MCS5420932.1 ABC transporter permease [Psychrilyobacter sp. S5]NDI77661.1 FtsX-like permease family protein [Psychrilyobacter piezotolerans]RDE62669.1 hypothetical protein DV867_06740 [Psychrilyobacter sp. S5]REI41599.1 hypothetical protein DYH56_06740 [Psychrilyobacter piezotolerans]
MSFWIAWRLMWGNKIRIFFPFAGITIGIASLILIFSLGEGGKKAIKADLAALAENRIMLGGERFDISDVRLIEEIPYISYVYLPQGTLGNNDIRIKGYSQRALSQLGISRKLREGEVLIEKNSVEILKGNGLLKGNQLEVQLGASRVKLRVIGEYHEKNPVEMIRPGGKGIIGLETLENILNKKKYDQMIVAFQNGENTEDLLPMVIQQLERKYGRRGEFYILEGSAGYKKIEKIKKTLDIFLKAIGIIAMIGGGLGISNLMAANVRERSSHIGIMRAVGISKNIILKIFLLEGSFISLAGGITGILAGILGGIIIGRIIGVPPIFKIEHITGILISALFTGIIFGLLPARRASQMEVVTALNID